MKSLFKPVLFLASIALITVMINVQTVHAAAPSALNKTMKDMGFALKKAVKAPSAQGALPHLMEFASHLEEAKKARFRKDLLQQSQKGLDEVSKELAKAIEAAKNDDLPLLQRHLKRIDKLRKEYHELHEPSIWDLLFG